MKHGAAPVFIVSLRPDPSCKVPGIIGLRRLLKSLLRSYGLVAVEIQEVHEAGASEARQRSEPEPTTAADAGARGEFNGSETNPRPLPQNRR